MKNETAQKILQQTKKDYDRMAAKFSGTRSYSWPDFEYFKPYMKKDADILDFGCGNGRLVDWLMPYQPKSYLGLDFSTKLIDIAKQKYQDTNWARFGIVETIHELSLPRNHFDHIFCIATLHHIPGQELRLQLLRQFYHWLKPSGYLFLTNWNLKQPKYRWTLFKFNVKKLFKQSELDWNDALIPFRNNQGQLLAQRYVHHFTNRSLAKLLPFSDWKIGINVSTEKNLVTVAEKR